MCEQGRCGEMPSTSHPGLQLRWSLAAACVVPTLATCSRCNVREGGRRFLEAGFLEPGALMVLECFPREKAAPGFDSWAAVRQSCDFLIVCVFLPTWAFGGISKGHLLFQGDVAFLQFLSAVL